MAAVRTTAFAAPYAFPLGGLGFQAPLIILFCKPLTFTYTTQTYAGVGSDRFVCLEEAPNSDAFQGTTLDLYHYPASPGELKSSSSRKAPGRQKMWTAFPLTDS